MEQGVALDPDPGPMVVQAVLAAVEREGVDVAPRPWPYASPWRRTALAEGVERLPGAPAGPRNTSGATLA